MSIKLQSRKSEGTLRHYQSVSELAFAKVKNHIQTHGRVENGDRVITMEGMDDSAVQRVNESLDTLQKEFGQIALEAYGSGKKVDANGKMIESRHTEAQLDAATLAMAYASDPLSFLKQASRKAAPAMEGEVVMASPVQSIERLRASMEAYDEKENRNAALYSATFNLMAAHQDEFGEAFFPTVVIPVDQTGFQIATRITRVINDIRRDQSGAVNDLNARNIVQAVIDASILRNDITNLVPVVRTTSAAYFVDAGDVAPTAVMVDGNPVQTAPLKIGAEFSLLGISQTDAELAKGQQDTTDAVDTTIFLAALYLKLKGATAAADEVIKLNTLDLPLTAWTAATQGNYRDMVLNFRSASLQVTGALTQVDGSASTLLGPVGTQQASVRLNVQLFGNLNTQTGTTSVNAAPVAVNKIAKAGVTLDLAAGVGKTLADIFANAEVIGYDLQARRTNSNLRNRGQLLDNTWQYQTYPLPIAAPISILHPMSQGDAQDAAELSSLITAARITTSNAAVTALLRARDVLAQHVNNDDGLADVPEIFGAAAYFVKPYFNSYAFDAAQVVDSIKSQDRVKDIQEALLAVIRNEVYEAYRASGYKAAADARAGGVAPTPTVIIGTDPVLSRWLMANADQRTIGPDFNIKIVSTLDSRVKGKIFISFGNFDGQNQGAPDFLHFGNMGWRPELVLTLPISRNNQISKELVVQPSFLHVPHLPVLVELDVTGISELVDTKAILKMEAV